MHGLFSYGASRFVEELAGAINRINYNQPNEQLNALAGGDDQQKTHQSYVRSCFCSCTSGTAAPGTTCQLHMCAIIYVTWCVCVLCAQAQGGGCFKHTGHLLVHFFHSNTAHDCVPVPVLVPCMNRCLRTCMPACMHAPESINAQTRRYFPLLVQVWSLTCLQLSLRSTP